MRKNEWARSLLRGSRGRGRTRLCSFLFLPVVASHVEKKTQHSLRIHRIENIQRLFTREILDGRGYYAKQKNGGLNPRERNILAVGRKSEGLLLTCLSPKQVRSKSNVSRIKSKSVFYANVRYIPWGACDTLAYLFIFISLAAFTMNKESIDVNKIHTAIWVEPRNVSAKLYRIISQQYRRYVANYRMNPCWL